MDTMETNTNLKEAEDASGLAYKQLLYLLKNTGLNIRQVSRLFNLPVREVGTWALDKSVPEKYRERLQSVYERIVPLGYSPEDVRRMLLKSLYGRSLFHRLVDEVKDTSPPIQVRALSVRDSLGI